MLLADHKIKEIQGALCAQLLAKNRKEYKAKFDRKEKQTKKRFCNPYTVPSLPNPDL